MHSPYPEILSIVLSFLVGAIPFGWVVFHLREGRDIRSVGSGNIGATNVYRFGGKPWGVFVLVLDILKGVLPALAGKLVFGPGWAAPAMAAAAVYGHCFTPYLRFRGGKGVATGLGAILVLAPVPVLLVLPVFVAIVWTTGYVSLGSISASLLAIVLAALFGVSGWVLAALAACSLLIVARHHSNIRKLIKGTEGKLGSVHPEEPR